MGWSHPSPTVATIVEPTERSRFDAAAQGCFAAIHAENVRDAIRTVRERPVHAVFVSPRSIVRDELAGVAALVKGFPTVTTAAVVSRHDAKSSQQLLALGASGVRRMFDLTGREGWRALRELVTHPVSPTAARILEAVVPALGEPSDDCRRFFEIVLRRAPSVPTVRVLAAQLRVRPSTFMSRFFRSGVPSPKRYLAATRLVHAAALFEISGLSIADVAYRLEHSSPQSFGRHLRSTTGMTAGEFRRRCVFDSALADYVARLIVPFRTTFRTFHPRDNGVMDLGHRW